MTSVVKREAVAHLKARFGLSERRAELTALIERRGEPGMIISDNGTELTSNAILKWCAGRLPNPRQ